MDKFEEEMSKSVMEVISIAKDCTPALFDDAVQQEAIIAKCKATALSIFGFKDAVKHCGSPLEASKLLDATSTIEAHVSSLLTMVKETNVVILEPQLIMNLEESVEKFFQVASSFRIFLGKSRTAGSKVHQGQEGAQDAVEALLEEESNAWDERSNTKQPSKEDLTRCAPWILDRLKREYKGRVGTNRLLEEANKKIEEERAALEEWKEKAMATFKAALQQKDESLKQRLIELQQLKQDEELQKTQSQKQLMAKDKQFLLNMSIKEQEMQDMNRQIAFLQKKLLRTKQKYQATKQSLETYIGEVEEWKREVNAAFGDQMEAKDQEIAELKEALQLVVAQTQQSGSSPERLEKIRNSLVTLSSTSYMQYQENDDVVAQQQAPKSAASKPVKAKAFKVVMPGGDGEFEISVDDYKENTTLGRVLEIIAAEKKWPIMDRYRFRHIEAPPGTPYLKYATRLGDLNRRTVRLVDTQSEQEAKTQQAMALQPRVPIVKPQSGDNGVSMPYNVYHADHKSVEDLLDLMQKSIQEVVEEEIRGSLVAPCPDWDIEAGDKRRPKLEDTGNRKLVDADRNTPYYQHYFFGKAHENYYAESDSRIGPVLVSLEVLTKDERQNYANSSIKMRALVRTKFDDEWVFIAPTTVGKSKAVSKAIETQCRNGSKMTGLKLKKLKHIDTPNELAKMEQRLMVKGYKWGVLYRKAGQTNEDEMFGNVDASPDFEEFLEFLGDKVVLKGYDKAYKGGLDVKNDSTGMFSVATKHCGFEIMFHVSTLLPYYPLDKQQLERKRHLGNDIVVIVFQEAEDLFNPEWIKSEFNHVFCVISKDKSTQHTRPHYKVNFTYKGGIGKNVPPILPFPPVFEADSKFREFLLTKLINAERYALYAPSFVKKVSKTKELQILGVLESLKIETIRGKTLKSSTD